MICRVVFPTTLCTPNVLVLDRMADLRNSLIPNQMSNHQQLDWVGMGHGQIGILRLVRHTAIWEYANLDVCY